MSVPDVLGGRIGETTKSWSLMSGAIGVQFAEKFDNGALASIAQGKGAVLAGQLMPKLASENAFKRWSSVSTADWMERLWRIPALFQRMERVERDSQWSIQPAHA